MASAQLKRRLPSPVLQALLHMLKLVSKEKQAWEAQKIDCSLSLLTTNNKFSKLIEDPTQANGFSHSQFPVKMSVCSISSSKMLEVPVLISFRYISFGCKAYRDICVKSISLINVSRLICARERKKIHTILSLALYPFKLGNTIPCPTSPKNYAPTMPMNLGFVDTTEN